MAQRAPLVLVDGELQELPVGDTIFGDNVLRDKMVHALLPSTATAISAIGTTYFSAGTISTPNRLNTSRKTKTWRWVNTSSAAAGNVIYHRPPTGEFLREDGFDVVALVGLTTLVPGNRWFAGITENTGNPTNIDPLSSTTHGKIGLAINSNAGTVRLVHNAAGSAPTIIDLGANFPIVNTDMWKLELNCVAGGNVNYKVTNTDSGAAVADTISANLPSPTTMLAKHVWGTNNATAATFAMDIARLYSAN